MLVIYDTQPSGLTRREGMQPLSPATAWLDLINPSAEEEKFVEAALSIDIPTREELQEIEASSRLYQEDGAHFMTATLLYQVDQPRPTTTHVTFILAGSRLITIRYAEPYSFQMFAARAMRNQLDCGNSGSILIGMLESIVDRLADLIERGQVEIDQLSTKIFSTEGSAAGRGKRYDEALRSIGRQGDLTTRARESLLSLNRLLTYLSNVADMRAEDKHIRVRIKTASRDVSSLADHLNFLNGQVTLLLEATLGMINIEQNAIIKIFSVVAVIFMPPTLIASIYGMNFHFMPELDWAYGYLWALALMVVSAIIPVLYFRHRGWL